VRSAPVDLYALLGVPRSATAAELRRAYRRLALRHHPDRAGPASAPIFAQIAEAYRMLSNLTARAAYDAHLFERETLLGRQPGAVQADGLNWAVSQTGWAATWQGRVNDLLPRLTGTLEELVAARVARVDSSGTLELDLSGAESASGGTAIVTLPLRILCPTCGGVASPRAVWCRRCEHEGHVTLAVPVRIAIPPAARDGLLISAPIGRSGAPQRVRIRVPG
jgi:DnaJ-class molecular chaperone